MTRIQAACYCLIASAFVLAALLFASLGGDVSNQAHAEMVITKENFTLMTAQTRNDEESLFVLDNSTGRLLIYTLNVPRKQLILSANANIGEIFARGGGDTNSRRR